MVVSATHHLSYRNVTRRLIRRPRILRLDATGTSTNQYLGRSQLNLRHSLTCATLNNIITIRLTRLSSCLIDSTVHTAGVDGNDRLTLSNVGVTILSQPLVRGMIGLNGTAHDMFLGPHGLLLGHRDTLKGISDTNGSSIEILRRNTSHLMLLRIHGCTTGIMLWHLLSVLLGHILKNVSVISMFISKFNGHRTKPPYSKLAASS